MPCTNRTSEFTACVESTRLRSAANSPSEAKQRLLPASARDKQSQRSQFTTAAVAISRDLQQTTAKLEKLAQLAKKKTLFDDRPVEISELTYIIKRDIASLNQQIASLQSLKAATGKKPVEEHNNNLVMMLQGRLANTSMGFKDVLEIRTQNMKASKERGEVFGSNTSLPATALRDSPLYAQQLQRTAAGTRAATSDSKGKGRVVDEEGSSDFLALDMAGGPSAHGMQQLQFAEPEDSYLSSRSTAIESIESTIAELGGIFQQLAQMVAQQGETVQRIDADTSDIASNVGGAQRELLKYYAHMSGNRMLMLKVFGVLMVFFLLFVLLT